MSTTTSGPQPTTCSSAATAEGADVLLGAPDWLDSKKWAWEDLRAGRGADFNLKCGALEASKADGWTRYWILDFDVHEQTYSDIKLATSLLTLS